MNHNLKSSKLLISKLITLASLLSCLSLFSSGCMLVHKMDIEQGNIITQENVCRIHRGMNIDQVVEIMGTPVLVNPFNHNRIDYIYTMKPGYGCMCVRSVILEFKHGVLVEIINK